MSAPLGGSALPSRTSIALVALFGLCTFAPSLRGPHAAELRWLGHDRIVDSATLDAGVATLGNDGLVMTWANERAQRWQQVDNASLLVAAPSGLLVVAGAELVTLDTSLNEVGRQPLDGVSPCRGVDALWWWTDAGSLDVFTAAGGARREGVVVPHGDARCGVSPFGSALAWVDASTAHLAVWSGTSIDVTSTEWDTADTPVPQWNGTAWTLGSSNSIRRFCDTWDGSGEPIACRESVDDTEFAELPRELGATWAAHLGSELVLADPFGWSLITESAATRRSPDGWITLGLLHRVSDVLVVGCQTRESGARVALMRPTGGNPAASTDILGSCANLRAWADGRGVSLVDAEGVLSWNPSSGQMERQPSSGVLAQSAPLGPLRWVLRLRETWTALCGAHTAVERVDADGTVRAVDVPCQRWHSLRPLFDASGALVGTTLVGETEPEHWTFSGVPAEEPQCQQAPVLPRGIPVPVTGCPLRWNDIRVTSTTRGVVLRDGERVWLSAALRPYAALVGATDVAYFGDVRRHSDFDAQLPARLITSSAR